MEFGDEQYDNLRKSQFYGKLIVASLEGTTQAKQQPEKFGALHYGGRQS